MWYELRGIYLESNWKWFLIFFFINDNESLIKIAFIGSYKFCIKISCIANYTLLCRDEIEDTLFYLMDIIFTVDLFYAFYWE